ncbi:MAG: hypothetical protein IT316_04930 [Anaerolineales bacterium]|nr:hypothetical protein [Anaerolineales bacterium]
MPIPLRRFVLTLIVLALSACQPTSPQPPTSTSEQDAYQASVATIASQLTGIAGTSDPNAFASPTPPFTETPTETLPNTSTPRPTETPFPTETPTPSPTLMLTAPTPTLADTPLPGEHPLTGLGSPSFVDTFSEGAGNWSVYSDEHVTMLAGEDSLIMIALEASRKNPYDAWMIAPVDLGDLYLEVSATPGDCAGLDRYGLLIRAAADASTAYVYGFSCDGKYSLRFWDGSKYYMLKEWTTSQYVQKGPEKTNRLGIRAEGNVFKLYANDALLTEIRDDRYLSGAVGLFVGAVQTDEFQVVFDRVSWWLLP